MDIIILFLRVKNNLVFRHMINNEKELIFKGYHYKNI